MTSKGYSPKQYKLTERRPQGKMTIGKMTIGRRPNRMMNSKEFNLTVRQPNLEDDRKPQTIQAHRKKTSGDDNHRKTTSEEDNLTGR